MDNSLFRIAPSERNNKKRIRQLVAVFNKKSLLKTVLVEKRRNVSEIDASFRYPDFIEDERFLIGKIPAQLLSYKSEEENEKLGHFINPNAKGWIVLQLHGGGYVNAFKKQYLNMAGLYAEAGRGIQVLSIDYRVAPENPYPAVLEDAIEAYKWILDKGYEPDRIIVAGDSAGGGLSMCLTAYLRDHGMPLPAGIIALSPWTDVTASGESYDSHYEDDPVFGGTRESLIYNNPYVGDENPKNPYISPLFGEFTAFPPMLIQVGECEMLFSDSEAAAQKAKEQGVNVVFTVYPEMFHVFQIAGTMMNESKKAWAEISRFIIALENREAMEHENFDPFGLGMTLTMTNGINLPMIGYGTYLAAQGGNKENIKNALKVGYRYLDTAAFYFNEEEIGEVLEECEIPREEIFVASKVWRDNLGYDAVIKSCEESLERLKLDYLDLFLIHWPRKDGSDGWEKVLADSWKAMEHLYISGKVKAIGVSNFLPHHFRAIENVWQIKPMVNQLELHIGYMQEYACEYCRDNGILLQAWSPLGRSSLLKEKVVVDMAEKYGVSPAALALRFLVQQEIAVIPKSSSVDRMRENINISGFEISEEDMSFLNCVPQMGWSGEHPDMQ